MIAVALAALFVPAATAASAGPSIIVSPSSSPQGGTVAISGNVPVSGSPSCAPGDPAQLTSTADLFPPDGFGPQVPRDVTGRFHTDYTIPRATLLGTYSIGVRCGGGNVGVSATLQVSQPATTTTVPATPTVPGTTTPPPPAAAGNGTSPIVWIVLGALAVLAAAGVGLLFVHRRGAGALR